MEDCYFEKGITTFNTIHVTVLMSDVINSSHILSQGGKNFGVDHNCFCFFLCFLYICVSVKEFQPTGENDFFIRHTDLGKDVSISCFKCYEFLFF